LAKAIKETLIKTCPDANLNINTDEIVQARVDTCVVMWDQYRVKRICTKTDNALKGVMKAHLKERTNYYTLKSCKIHP